MGTPKVTKRLCIIHEKIKYHMCHKMLKFSLLLSLGTCRLIDKREALDRLKSTRLKRNNDGWNEEYQKGNFERECVEELCTREELHETPKYKNSDQTGKIE